MILKNVKKQSEEIHPFVSLWNINAAIHVQEAAKTLTDSLFPLNYGFSKAVNKHKEELCKVAFSWVTTTDMCVFLTVSKSYLFCFCRWQGDDSC